MTNVDVKISGNKMIIEVDLTQDHGPSASGKTNIIASTHGFQKLDDVSISLNVVKKAVK